MLKQWWTLFRAEHSVIVALAVIVSQFVATKQLSWGFLYPALGPVLITLGAFAWSDYFGLGTDRALKRKERPLVSGKINPRQALWAGLILMIAGVSLTYFVNSNAFMVAFAYTLASFLYDPFLKKRPLLGNAFIASSMSISFIYGNLAVSPTLNANVLLYAAVAFLAGFGRELVITLRDVEGDRKIGATTLPMLLGPRKTVVLASVLIYFAIFLSLIPLMASLNWVYLVLVVVTSALFLAGTYYILLSQRLENLKKARNVTLYGLLVGVLAFAALGL